MATQTEDFLLAVVDAALDENRSPEEREVLTEMAENPEAWVEEDIQDPFGDGGDPVKAEAILDKIVAHRLKESFERAVKPGARQ